jgi:hypothetical protein
MQPEAHEFFTPYYYYNFFFLGRNIKTTQFLIGPCSMGAVHARALSVTFLHCIGSETVQDGQMAAIKH